jgi:hypothetical protein
MNGFGQENQLNPAQYPSGNRHRNLNDTPSGKILLAGKNGQPEGQL